MIKNVETTVFQENRPRKRGRKLTESSQTLRNMVIGSSLRIIHPDVSCTIGNQVEHQSCTLAMGVYHLQKRYPERRYEYYHEANKILVIRRTA